MSIFDQDQKIGGYSMSDWNTMSALDAQKRGSDFMGLAGATNIGAGSEDGGMFGLNGLLKDNSSTLGFLGGMYDLWGDSQNRKETRRLNDQKIDYANRQMAMTQTGYNNNLARSKNAGADTPDTREYMTGTYGTARTAPQQVHNASPNNYAGLAGAPKVQEPTVPYRR